MKIDVSILNGTNKVSRPTDPWSPARLLVLLVSLPLLFGGGGKKENITEVLESVTATKLIEPTVEIEKNGLTSLIRLIKQ